jgi:UDP-glucose 4-epimerase
MPDISGGRFVVVGGASQVGSHIGEQLLAAGAGEVVLLDNLSLGSSDMLQPLLADRRCRFIRGDMLRPSDLFDAFAGADGVFAVAALMATSIGENPWVGLDVNIRGLQNTLEACRCQRVKKVVISSSAGVYGLPSDVPTDEDSPLRWQSLPPSMTLYCASKVIGEGLAQLYRQRHGLDFVALRYTAVYGERQHRRALVGGHIADTCERIRRGEPPIVQGDGQHVFDYVHAGDVARANLLAMESAVSGEGINICSGVETSQSRIVELVAQACGSPQQAVQRERTVGARLPSTARQSYSRDKARRLLGWEPQVSIEEGVARVLRWVDERDAAGA